MGVYIFYKGFVIGFVIECKWVWKWSVYFFILEMGDMLGGG